MGRIRSPRQPLAGRFQLAFHRERGKLSIYALTVGRNGPKLQESTSTAGIFPARPPPLIFVVSPRLVRLPGRYATMGESASVMQPAALDHPVVDRTGLSAGYDFDLEWAPDETQFGGSLGDGPEETTTRGFFAALQKQPGLKLEATQGPVDVLVIDPVAQPPET